MSASQEKKIRKEQRAQGVEKRQVKQKKAAKAHKKQTWIGTTVTVLVVLLAAFIILLNTNFFYHNFTAVRIGDVSYNASEFNYYFHNSYYTLVNQYGDYISQIGLDTTKPLASQTAMSGGTWADYFKEQATTSMQQITMLWNEAVKEGFELSDEDRASMEQSMDSLGTTYKEAGYKSADDFLAANYGRGVTEDMVRKLIERSYIASAYSAHKRESLTYSDSELEAYYKENENSFDKFTFAAYFVDGSVPETSEGDAADASATDLIQPDAEPDAEPVEGEEPAAEMTAEEAMAAAKSKAQSIVDNSIDLDSFLAGVEAESGTAISTTSATGSDIAGVYGDWLKDASRVPGDKTVIEDESGYYAMFFVSRDNNDYATKNCRHILIKAAADEDGTVTEEAKAAAKTRCEELLAQWQSGDATEDSFAALANEYSEDAGSNTKGGLYENVEQGRFVPEFNAWLYDPERKAGDTGIVYNDSSQGYHLVYFVGNGENYHMSLADTSLRNADYTQWETDELEKYPVSKGLTYGLTKQVVHVQN